MGILLAGDLRASMHTPSACSDSQSAQRCAFTQSMLRIAVHSQAVFDSCRTLDLRNATVTLSCVDLLRDAKSLECLRLRSDYFTADKDCSKHAELQRFIALLPVSCKMPLTCFTCRFTCSHQHARHQSARLLATSCGEDQSGAQRKAKECFPCCRQMYRG